jgi:hypothetical protein
MTIKALRLLPPLAFARFGSASEPQPSYELHVDPGSPLGFRQIGPDQTLHVTREGKLAIEHPVLQSDKINEMFRDGPRIRPVAPFFELFAIIEEDTGKQRKTASTVKRGASKSAHRKKETFEPVTLRLLKKYKLDPSDIAWKVHVENRKVFRRTGDPKDKVVATTRWFSSHGRQQLRGICGNCSKPINLGYVQFVRPSDPADEVSSRLRLRFTPAPGEIYGPVEHRTDGQDGYVPSKKRAIYKRTGSWPDFDQEKPGTERTAQGETWPRETLPPSLYANTNQPPAAPWLNHDRAKSRGYLDDACDGFIYVTIKGRVEMQAKARICVSPPAFIPDSQFVRSLADDLDQIVNGPEADDITDTRELRRRALDIVRRGFETVRFMNVAVMNGNPVDDRPAEAFDTMPAEEAFATERLVRPVMATANVDNQAVLGLHQRIFAALSSGAAPWFLRLLRRPDEVGDLTDQARRKMPALMSGADSYYLALTHRQIATIEKVAQGEALTPRNRTARERIAQKLAEQLRHRAAGNPPTSRPDMAIANCCPGLEVDFRAVWRRLFVGIELCEWDNYVVEAGTALDETGKEIDLKWLKGHRLLRVGQWKKDGTFEGNKVIVTLEGPSPSDPGGKVTVRSSRNPNGVWTMEWSNCLADVVKKVRNREQEWFDCEFTAKAAKDPQPAGEKPPPPGKKPQRAGVESKWVRLRAREFFNGDSAVISDELAEPGELTQGLCSPWQNDLRECSCFYWASSRPDFVNTHVGNDGLTHGDYWFARKRTGEYVPDDYADSRLMTYDDLFKEWEKLLQFQIGGKDSMPELLDLPEVSSNLRRREP